MAENQINIKSLTMHLRGMAQQGRITEPDATNIIVAMLRAKSRLDSGKFLFQKVISPATISDIDAMKLVIDTSRDPKTPNSVGALFGIFVVDHSPIADMKAVDSLEASLPELRLRLRQEHDEADSTIDSDRRRQLFEKYNETLSLLKATTEKLVAYANSDNGELRSYAANAIKRDLDLLSLHLAGLREELDGKEAKIGKNPNEGSHEIIVGLEYFERFHGDRHLRTVEFQHFDVFYQQMEKQLEQYARSTNWEVALHVIQVTEQGKFDPDIIYSFTYSHSHNESVRREACESIIRLFNNIADTSTPDRIRYTLIDRIVCLAITESCLTEFNSIAISKIGDFLASEGAGILASDSMNIAGNTYGVKALTRLTEGFYQLLIWSNDKERALANANLMTGMLKNVEERNKDVPRSPLTISIHQVLEELESTVIPKLRLKVQ